MLSQTVEYALRAVLCVAQHPEKPLTTHQIAGLTRVPISYLSKVLQLLGKAGIIVATRGIYGGYALSGDPSKMTILHVVNAIDPIKRFRGCPLSIESHHGELCPLHRSLDQVLQHAEDVFGETSLAALLNDKSGRSPLCGALGADSTMPEPEAEVPPVDLSTLGTQ